MKLLLDENLSRRLVPFLEHDYPGSSQVTLLGLQSASDRDIWDYAKANDYVLVTLDGDFQDLSTLLGAPPQVIWLRIRNRSRQRMLKILVDSKTEIIGSLEIDQNALIQIQNEEL